MSKTNVKRLCIEAMMAALYVVFDILATHMSTLFGKEIKISLSGLVVIVCAVLYGPVSGMLVGLTGAFIGQMLTYGFTATTVLWILPAGIRGLSAGLIFLAFKKSLKPHHLITACLVSSLLVTIVNTIVSYIDSVIYHYPYAVFAFSTVTRFGLSILTAIVYSIILIPLIHGIKNIIKE